MATIFERIRKVTTNQLADIKEEEITPSSNFVDDLGADSLDLVELIMAFEDEFTTSERKIGIPDEDAEKILTVQDVMDYIRDKGVTDNELPRSAEKTSPKPNMRPAAPAHQDSHKAAPSKTGQAPPSSQPKTGQNRPGGNRPANQYHPRQGTPQRRQGQPPRPPSGPPPS